MLTLWRIAYRDLGRNRRRSILTLIAVALGLALLVVTSGLIEGAIAGAIENNIRVQTSHVQLRNESYDEDKVSLKWQDLMENPSALAKQVQAQAGIQAAAPLLWASGILGTGDESVGVRVFGIDPLADINKPYRDGIVAGEFLSPDDRSGILIGRKLAQSLGLAAGREVSLLINTSDEQPDQAIFTIRGLYDTGIPSFDDTTLLMPLTKAQTFTRAGDRASAILLLLDRQESADRLAPTLRRPGLQVFTWRDLNQVLLQAVEMTNGLMYLMYMIVLAVVAVVIANTLLMSVFERTREMGILAALGMKGRQILAMFILEAAILGLVGIVLGDLLGSLGVLYLATEGYHIGDVASITTASVAYGETIYARFAPGAMAALSFAGMIITLLASLYPAWMASRLEPIEALRAQ